MGKNDQAGEVASASWFERTWRWWVLGTLFLATFLNYLDRQTLANTIIPIRKEFGLSGEQCGDLLAAFIYTYALSHLFVGFFLDRVRNIRWVFPVFVIGWSISGMLVGWADSYEEVLWLRYLLGVWESANFPMCLMIIARIFSGRQRSLATGIFNSGAFLATLVAPPLVIWLSNTYNWRWSFLIIGLLGFLWLVPWLLIFRHPQRRALNWPSSERPGKHEAPSSHRRARLSDILRSPAFWGVVLVGVGIVPGLYFMTQWLPSYLTQAWEVEYTQALGYRLAFIFLMQDLGLWLGGGFVWLLAAKGLSVLNARRTVMAIGYLLMMSMMLMPLVGSVNIAVVLLAVYVLGLGACLANQQAFKQDVARANVATVAALAGFVETGFAAFVVDEVGMIVEKTGGFNAVFLMFGASFTLALVAMFALLRKVADH